jgi:hypothetical protein
MDQERITMNITPLKTFRNKHNKGQLLRRGVSVNVDDTYGQVLVQTGLATNDAKSLKEYENKMLAEYADKGHPTEPDTPESRSEGVVGPTSKSETPEVRTQGKFQQKASFKPPAPTGAPAFMQPKPSIVDE